MPKRDPLITDAEREHIITRLCLEAGLDAHQLPQQDDQVLVEWLSQFDATGSVEG